MGEKASALRSLVVPAGQTKSKSTALRALIGDKKTTIEEAPTGNTSGFFKNYLDTITDAVVETGDLMEKVNPVFGGLRWLQNIAGVPSPREQQGKLPWNVEGDPTTLPGRMGRYAGIATTIAPIFGGVTSKIPKAATTAGKLPGFLQNLVNQGGQAFIKAPKMTVVSETVAGASAGAAGYAAEQQFPDSTAARITAELLGGAAPSVMKDVAVKGAVLTGKLISELPGIRLLLKKGGEIVNRAMENTTLGAGTGRTLHRIGRATKDTQGALARMDDEILPGSKLTPAAKTEDLGLLSLERSVLTESRKIDEIGPTPDQMLQGVYEDIAETNRVIRESLNTSASTEFTKKTFASEISNYFNHLLDTRVKQAGIIANDLIRKLRPGTTAEVANRITMDEVEKALGAARAQEGELYNLVPEALPVRINNFRERLAKHISVLGKAQREDIPARALASINPKSTLFLGKKVPESSILLPDGKPASPGGIDFTSTIRDVRALQSKLREVARRARSKKSFNKARVADDLADALSKDIETDDSLLLSLSAEGDDSAVVALQNAIKFSKDLHDRFSKGTIGKMLGKDVQGGKNVKPGLALESTIKSGGPQAREAYDDLLKALDNPNVEGSSSEVVQGAVVNYIRNQFMRAATGSKGKIIPEKAKAFLQSHDELLGRIPGLKKQIQEAIDAGDVLALRTKHKAWATESFRESKAAIYTHKSPEDAFDMVVASEKPVMELQKLINLTKRDPTGEALKGLKESFLNYMGRKAITHGQLDVTDNPFISGIKLRELSNNPKVSSVMNRLFSKAELSRYHVIERTAVKLDKQRHAKPSKEGVLGDEISVASEWAAGILGAAFGRWAGRVAHSGGTVQIPGKTAALFKTLVEAGVKNPAKRLLNDMVLDEPLYREVLQAKLLPNKELPKQATRRLHSWAIGVLMEEGLYDKTAEDEEISELIRR